MRVGKRVLGKRSRFVERRGVNNDYYFAVKVGRNTTSHCITPTTGYGRRSVPNLTSLMSYESRRTKFYQIKLVQILPQIRFVPTTMFDVFCFIRFFVNLKALSLT